jgi:hypothetical protein
MPLESLNLKILTYKLIALVALTTAARAQTLSALYLNYMSLFHDKVSFNIFKFKDSKGIKVLIKRERR